MAQNIYFDGSGDYLIANSPAGNFATNDFTIEGIVSLRKQTTDRAIFGNYNVWNANSLILVQGTTDVYKVAVTSTGYPVITSIDTINYKNYQHFALTREGTKFSLFVDGKMQGLHISSANLTHSSGNLWIGTDGSSVASVISGWTKGFRVIKNECLYKHETIIPSSELPNNSISDSYYSNTSLLLHGNGINGSNTIINNGNNNVSITIYGNTSISNSQVKYGNGSIRFDGSGDYLTVGDVSDSSNLNVEVLTNGNFSNGSNSWTLTNSVVSGGVLTVTSGANFAYQTNVLKPGALYEVSFTMTYTSGNSIRINTGSTGGSGDGQIYWNVTNGTVTGRFYSVGTLFSIEARNAVFTGTIDNISVKMLEVTPYFTNLNSTVAPDFTIETWVYPIQLSTFSSATINSSTVPYLMGVMSPLSGDATNYWSFGPLSNGTVRFYYFTGTTFNITSTETIVANQWSHIALTKSSNKYTVWVNGKGSVIGTQTGTISNGAAFVIGSYSGSSVNGYVDDLRITYGNCRYTSDFTPPTKLDLTSNTTLLTANASTINVNNSVIDVSNTTHIITVVGDVGLVADYNDLFYTQTAANVYSFSANSTSNTTTTYFIHNDMKLWNEFKGVGKIYGTLKERIINVDYPVSNTNIFLYSKETKQCIAQTTSNISGYYIFNELNFNKKYYVISFEPNQNTNAVIADNITPKLT